MLTEDRLTALLAYCKLSEFADDPEVQALIPVFFSAAVGYMTQAGISLPPEGSPRRAQYDLCINHMVLNSWENRETSYVGTVTVDNPAFRRMVTQLKLTETGSASNPDAGEA